MATAWAVLVGIACLRLGSQIPYYFFPFLGYKADPWGRGQIGTGPVDAAYKAIDAVVKAPNNLLEFVVHAVTSSDFSDQTLLPPTMVATARPLSFQP